MKLNRADRINYLMCVQSIYEELHKAMMGGAYIEGKWEPFTNNARTKLGWICHDWRFAGIQKSCQFAITRVRDYVNFTPAEQVTELAMYQALCCIGMVLHYPDDGPDRDERFDKLAAQLMDGPEWERIPQKELAAERAASRPAEQPRQDISTGTDHLSWRINLPITPDGEFFGRQDAARALLDMHAWRWLELTPAEIDMLKRRVDRP